MLVKQHTYTVFLWIMWEMTSGVSTTLQMSSCPMVLSSNMLFAILFSSDASHQSLSSLASEDTPLFEKVRFMAYNGKDECRDSWCGHAWACALLTAWAMWTMGTNWKYANSSTTLWHQTTLNRKVLSFHVPRVQLLVKQSSPFSFFYRLSLPHNSCLETPVLKRKSSSWHHSPFNSKYLFNLRWLLRKSRLVCLLYVCYTLCIWKSAPNPRRIFFH